MAHQTSTIQRKQPTPRPIGRLMDVDFFGGRSSISRCMDVESWSSCLRTSSLRGVDLNHANTFISPLLPVSGFILSKSHCVLCFTSATSRTILGQGQDTVYRRNARQVRL